MPDTDEALRVVTVAVLLERSKRAGCPEIWDIKPMRDVLCAFMSGDLPALVRRKQRSE